jgi:hypothetical protein
MDGCGWTEQGNHSSQPGEKEGVPASVPGVIPVTGIPFTQQVRGDEELRPGLGLLDDDTYRGPLE